MAASHVVLRGLNAAACKYFTMRRIPVWSCRTFAHWRVLGNSGMVEWVEVMGSFQSPVRGSRGPVMTTSSLFVMTTVVLSKVALHPASHSVPMDTSELCVRPGMMCALRASLGSCGMSSVHWSGLDCRVAPLGRPTVIWS
jgi:hypothetical protein